MSDAADKEGSLPGAENAAAAPAPRLTPPGEGPSVETPSVQDEEVDVWWGAYSGWTMLPAFVIALLLTGGWAGGCWSLASADLARFLFFCGASLLWLGLLARWLWRVFGYNYRLTNRRLFQDRGVIYTNALQGDLTDVAHIVVARAGWERLLGLGRVRVVLNNGKTLVLSGVRQPGRMAELLRDCVKKANDWKLGEPGAAPPGSSLR
jgi:hypothetical protein